MKILQFIYSLDSGGAERFVVDLTNELSLSNEVKLFVLRDDTIENQGFYKSEISSNVVYTNLKITPGFKPRLIWSFLRILIKEKPDVVHCHLNLVNYFFLSSVIFRNKIKFLYTLHSSAKSEVISETERQIRRFFFKHHFFIPVAISGETKNSYIDYYKLNEIPVVYNGRGYSKKTSDFEKVRELVHSFKITKETLVFSHVARYDEQKNQKMLISVFNRVKKDGFDVVLLIIGKGFDAVPELKAMANSHIHFLGLKTNVADFLYVSDAFCLSSTNEGMPISLIEAFGCSCIPICTPVGGIVDTIQNGISGFLSKSVSEDDYYDAILTFIKNRHSIEKKTLQEYFDQNFSIEKCAKEYMNLYIS